MKKVFIFISTLLSAAFLLSGQNFMDEKFFSSEEISYEKLLEGYAKTNGNLERMKIKLEAAEISNQQSNIKNGVSVNISSGNAKVTFDKTKGTEVNLIPSASVKVPGLNNLAVTASVPTQIDNDGLAITGTSVGVSADILTANKTNLKISNIESERSLQNAKKNLVNQEMGVEGEFLSAIQSIYDKASSLMQARESYLSQLVSLDQVILSGYSKSSSKYKIAMIEKDSAYSDCEKAYRELKNLLSDLSAKCGYEINSLITDIPDIELVDFESFPVESFSQIEQALYNQEMGELKRSVNKNWTLTGNLKYDMSKKNSGDSISTIGAGIDTTWKGLGMGLGVSVPVSSEANPSLNFNISVNPFAWKNSTLSEQSSQLDKKLEALDVSDAYEKYTSSKRSYKTQAETIMWESQLLNEQITYYREVYDEMTKAYKSGLINKNDYIKAENQYNKAYINLLKNKIKKFQYNLEVKKLFVNQ